jgi:hypothetical protein
MTCYILDENNQLGLGDDAVEIGVDVDYTVSAASGPSWSEWSGGDPGSPASLDIQGWSVDSVVVGKTPVDYKTLPEVIQKKITALVEDNFDNIEDQIWDSLS